MIFRLFLIAVAFTFASGVARATHTVSVPNYPTLQQLESGWNAAFASWLTSQYGGTPTITSTTTYAGQDGQIFVVSTYTAGTAHGTILGRAFDPQDATPLGGGNYWYEVEKGFTCTPEGSCQICDPHERHYPDGSYERWCNCFYNTGEKGACALVPVEELVGSYEVSPTDYGSLPAL